MAHASHIAGPDDFANTFGVSHETIVKLKTYRDLLVKWQKTINLVAPSTLADIWHRHFADSAQLLGVASTHGFPIFMPNPPIASAPLRWLDLGSGAGFPGLVVAIMLAEHRAARVTLIESDQRKAAFLREVARQTGAPVDILSIRIEKAATQFILPLPEVVTARALAPLNKLLQLVSPFFAPSTVGLFPKGRDAEREVEEARQRWQFEWALQPSLTDEAARIVIVKNVKANSEE